MRWYRPDIMRRRIIRAMVYKITDSRHRKHSLAITAERRAHQKTIESSIRLTQENEIRKKSLPATQRVPSYVTIRNVNNAHFLLARPGLTSP